MGEDIAIDTDYTTNQPACKDELNALRITDLTAQELGTTYKLLLDDPGAENESRDLDLDALVAAVEHASAERAAGIQVYEACMARQIIDDIVHGSSAGSGELSDGGAPGTSVPNAGSSAIPRALSTTVRGSSSTNFSTAAFGR